MIRLAAVVAVVALLAGCRENVREVQGPKGEEGAQGERGAAGAAGLTALVVTVAEPQGTNCSAGGTKILSGLDANSNGALDTAEVSSTRFVCNGVPGADGAAGDAGAPGATGPKGDQGDAGAPGFTSLLATTNEPSGANCAGGGVKVESGVDTNRDGTLQAAEVTATRYVCNGLNGASPDAGSGATGSSGCGGNVWRDADGGFVACGDALEYEVTTSASVAVTRKAVRFTDSRGYIWRADPASGYVDAWADPQRGPYDPNWTALYGYGGPYCAGAEYFIPTSNAQYVPPRYVYRSPAGTFWARPDNLPIGAQTNAINSISGGCGNGCDGPAYGTSCPNPWPSTFYALPLAAMTPSPALTKPPDFAGPLHLSPQ